MTAMKSGIKNEFFLALNQVATERGIPAEEVVESLKIAIVAAYKKDYGHKNIDDVQPENEEETPEDDGYEATIDPDSGEFHITLEGKDITPPGFGRIAAQTARQVIFQHIRDAEKKTIIQHYSDLIGTITKGRVIRYEGRRVIMDIGKAEATLPIEEQIRIEDCRLNEVYTVYIKEISEDNYGNSRIIISRTAIELVQELFKKEVPEIASGTVQIHKIVREPGERTKMAVHSDQQGVDPVGACVGQKGVRVKSVTDELGGNEKIDVIQYSEVESIFIKEALSPAEIESVDIDKKTGDVTVMVKEDQAPLAIGRNGVNVMLASELINHKINVQKVEGPQAAPKAKEEKEAEPTPSEPAPQEETPAEELAPDQSE